MVKPGYEHCENIGLVGWEEDCTIECDNVCIEDQSINASSCNCELAYEQ